MSPHRFGFEGSQPDPITPHAAPVRDSNGHLTYVGADGRRYVVALPPEAEPDQVERLMANLHQGDALFHQIELLCSAWIKEVAGEDLDPAGALSLLLTTLEVALDPDPPMADE